MIATQTDIPVPGGAGVRPERRHFSLGFPSGKQLQGGWKGEEIMDGARKEEVRKAASLLMDAGICCYILGHYNINTPDEAAEFAMDPDAYYRALYVAEGEEKTEELREEAQEAGVPFEAYVYFYKYARRYDYLRWQTFLTGEHPSYCAPPFVEASCSYLKKNGEECRNTVRHFPLKKNFADFRPGIHDRCHQHREGRAQKAAR